jgi:hypothetical protein
MEAAWKLGKFLPGKIHESLAPDETMLMLLRANHKVASDER